MFDIREQAFYRVQEKTIVLIMVLNFLTKRLKTQLKRVREEKRKNIRKKTGKDLLGPEMDGHLEDEVNKKGGLEEDEKRKKMIALEVLMNLYRKDINNYEEHNTRFFAEELVTTVDEMYEEDALASNLRRLVRDREKQEKFFRRLQNRVRERAVDRLEEL